MYSEKREWIKPNIIQNITSPTSPKGKTFPGPENTIKTSFGTINEGPS